MKGIVLHFDGANENGVIRAEDGRRYGFTAWDYKSAHNPRVGDEIDFEIQEGVAADIYVVKAAAAASLDLMALRRTVTEGTGKVAERITRNWAEAEAGEIPKPVSATGFMKIMLNDWRHLLAALALVASLLPLLSFGPFSANLFGAVSSASMANTQLTVLRDTMQAFAPSTTTTNPWNMAPQKSAQTTAGIAAVPTSWALRAAWLLYAIPLLAMITLIQLFRGRDSTRPAFWLGVASVSLVPAAMFAAQEFATLQKQIAQMSLFGGTTGFGITQFLDFGFYALVGIGAAILLVHAGIIGARPPKAYIVSPA